MILMLTLVALVAAFFYLGGPARLANHFAETAIDRRDLTAAKGWLDISGRFSPHDSHRHFLAARVARREGNLPRMSSELDRALQYGFDPERIRRERLLGQAQMGQLEGIETELNKWLSEGGSDMAEISEAYANGLASASRLEPAMQVLRAWQQDRPDDPAPLYRLGRIHEHSDLLPEAEKYYRAAIAVDENYLPALYSLGRVLLDDKKPASAIVFFERCLTAPNPAAAKIGVARCLVEMGETDRAAEILYSVVKQDPIAIRKSYQIFGETPERFVAAAELGKLEANAGNFEEAKRLLDLAIEENPRDLPARYSRAVALRGLGQQEQAAAEFEYVRDVQQVLQQVDGFQARIRRTPEDTEARIGLGKLLMEYESERSGLFWLRSVLVYDADNAQAHQAIADYYESHAEESPRNAHLASEHRQRASAGRAD